MPADPDIGNSDPVSGRPADQHDSENSENSRQGGVNSGLNSTIPPTPHNEPVRSSDGQHKAQTETEAGQRIEHASIPRRVGRAVSNTQAILAIVGVITLAVTMGQLVVMQGQLREMRSSGVDTHTLAEAAQKQATAAAAQAVTMEGQLVVLKNQLETALFQQRPDIRLAPNPLPVFIEGSSKIGWNVNITNNGQHDAINVHSEGYISINGGKLRRGIAFDYKSLSNGDPIYFTVLSPDNYKINEFDAFMKLDGGIALYVKSTFLDDSGRQKSIDRCWGHMSNGALMNLELEICDKNAVSVAGTPKP